jgi:hypothetical protein
MAGSTEEHVEALELVWSSSVVDEAGSAAPRGDPESARG